MAGELRKKTKSALIWNTINQFGRFGFRFIVTVVLARILTPEDFGLVAMILVITSFSDFFIDSGFKIGIVQQKTLSDEELSSVFFLNILVGAGFMLLVFLIAPIIGSIYENEQLVPLTQVLSLVYLFKSFSIVQQGLINRKMEFKKLTISTVGAQLFAGTLAITLAIIGWGVWSLIINLVVEAFLISVLFWVQSSWKPKWIFRLSAIKSLWGFSSKLLLMNLLANIGNKIDLFFIGKFFNPQTVGLYSKSKDFSLLPANIGTQVITTSFFPVFSKIQDNHILFISIYTKLYKLLLLSFTPLFAIMFLCADQIILILLGKAWMGAIIYFKWGAVMALMFVVNGFMNYVINSKGRSDLNLKRALIHTPLRIGMFIAIPFLFSSFTPLYFIFVYISFFISANIMNKYFVSKICGIDIFENLKMGLEYIVFAVGIILFIHYINGIFDFLNNYGILTLKTMLFLGLYCLILAISKNKLFYWSLNQIKLKISHGLR